VAWMGNQFSLDQETVLFEIKVPFQQDVSVGNDTWDEMKRV
jgi:hypothetical protein